MKLLKVLVNSLLSGLFFSLLLSLLLVNLNINLDFKISLLCQLTLFLSLSYGLLVVIISLLIFFISQFISGRKFKIAFISPSFLSFSFSLLILLFLLIFWENYKYFLSFFNSEVQSLLKTQMRTFLFLAVLGFVIFFGFHYYKRNALFFLFYFLLLGAAMVFIFSQRQNYPHPQKAEKLTELEAQKIEKKIIVIGLEGLSFDFIIPLVSEEKLPNFAWLVNEGSWGRLENFSPNEPFILNNSFNSGKYPSQHRQISLFRYHIPKIKERIEVAPRFILLKQLTRTGLLRISTSQPAPRTKDIWQILSDNKAICLKREWPYGQEIIKPSQKAEKLLNLFFKDLQSDESPIVTIAKQAFFHDCEYEEKALEERTRIQPQFFYLLLNGLNTVETFFYKYSFPESFGNIDQDLINKYGPLIQRYYEFYDQIIGKYLATLKEDELLVVYSPHGTEPLPLWKRFVEWILGNPDVCAHHENAPDGVIFFYGKEVVRGKNIEGMKLVDVVPTLLYYLDLPVGEDMDGVVTSSLFIRDFTAVNPVSYISSYDELIIKGQN